MGMVFFGLLLWQFCILSFLQLNYEKLCKFSLRRYQYLRYLKENNVGVMVRRVYFVKWGNQSQRRLWDKGYEKCKEVIINFLILDIFNLLNRWKGNGLLEFVYRNMYYYCYVCCVVDNGVFFFLVDLSVNGVYDFKGVLFVILWYCVIFIYVIVLNFWIFFYMFFIGV